MEKIVKFSGTKQDNRAYLTVIFAPKNKEKLKDYVDFVRLSAHLGKDTTGGKGELGVSLNNYIDRFAQLEVKDDRIILQVLYVSTSSFAGYFENIERDYPYIVEQIETLIDALGG
ncbi:hypothetical protein KKF60_01145 [Patescibacteria group bacterium]|nr:hypothetical protein [Patescibacteria group bacterium]MBU4458490.1 hypothetical protein [Patescibacteria group bacterium]MCG2696358.1 hypothetical protein [Candidatus Portnoybacteria bacterium]